MNLGLAFLHPSADADEPWMNRLTGWVSSHNVCHVELYFPTLDQCFSVQSGGVAQLRHKQLSNPGYTVVTLGVSRKEYDDCLCFCKGAVGIPFADAPMLRAYVHGLVTPTPILACAESSSQASGATFCSKIVTEALQFADVREVADLHPACSTPSRLLVAVSGSERRVVGSVPYKERSMLAKAVTM